ncbi:MAG: CdaR family protein [Bacillota bacterium]|jgi:YbbR domain-containing protein|nr:CdaR family protein [Bacillota bacterium]
MRRIGKLLAFLTKPEVYWRIFSLFLAIVFWLLATGDGTLGETERIVTVAVEAQNVPADLIVVDPPQSVRVRIRGLSPLLNRGESAVAASIDLSGAVEGTETYSVAVEGPLGVRIVSVTPQWVSVYTEELAEAVFPVTLAFLGISRTSGPMGIRPSPAVVTLRGPRSILDQVDHVVAYLSGDPDLLLEETFSVQALDAQGRSLSGLELDPPTIRIVESVDQGEE